MSVSAPAARKNKELSGQLFLLCEFLAAIMNKGNQSLTLL
jgi:hypothetical protein